MASKICTKCGAEKLTSEYYPKKRGRYGVSAVCKVCDLAKSKARRDREREAHYKEHPEDRPRSVPNGYKHCAACDTDKTLDCFYNLATARDGKQTFCKECQIRYMKDLRARDPRKFQDIRNARNKRYRAEDPEGSRQKANKYEAERRRDFPNVRIAKYLRNRLNRFIHDKHGHTFDERLGCTADELKIHLESQFQEGMSWDNYGFTGWHIDHIMPISTFDLTKEDEMLRCCHYSNLQPLWAKDNLSKGAKILG